jgi:aminomethyltransferase
MVPFSGWEMPVEYSGITDEHLAVRTRAGLFDVSHMGEIEIAGRDALKGVQHITSNDAAKLSRNQAQYSALTTAEGTFVDDVLTYRLADDHFMLVVNASNIIKDFNWITKQLAGIGDAVAVNTSSRYALLALQGPAARDVLQTLTGVNLSDIKYYWFTTGEVAGVAGTISRTGYTGEDGFEVFVPPASAERVWDAILQAGKPAGIVAAGLGARDTLRLEAGMPLYGHELNESIDPISAGLGWAVDVSKDFVGVGPLRSVKENGPKRKLVGLELDGKRIARQGMTVMSEGTAVGEVTSGTFGPTVQKSIAMAFVDAANSAEGTTLTVDLKGTPNPAKVVKLPFYKRTT